MKNKNDFYNWFDKINNKLGIRSLSFTKIFNYLDKLPDPIIIIETGCLRAKDNFLGDGQSTLLFDKYTQSRGNGSKVFTVDIDPVATNICKSLVSDNVDIFTGDSVKYLIDLTKKFYEEKINVSMFFLDSCDVEWIDPGESSSHHLKEIECVKSLLNEKTIVVVDDSPIMCLLSQVEGQENNLEVIEQPPATKPFIGGKGSLVHKYAASMGAKLYFSHYQSAWVGFKTN
jgi:cephalosporin hydroxylase